MKFKCASCGTTKVVNKVGTNCFACRTSWVKFNKPRRPCRKCGGPLPPSRYYNCLQCMAELPQEPANDGELYGATSRRSRYDR